MVTARFRAPLPYLNTCSVYQKGLRKHKEGTSIVKRSGLTIELFSAGSHFLTGSCILLYNLGELLYCGVDLIYPRTLFLTRRGNILY